MCEKLRITKALNFNILKMQMTKFFTKKLNGLCFYLEKPNCKACIKFKTHRFIKIDVYLLQN